MPSRPVSVSPFSSLRGAPRLADGHSQARRQPRGRVAEPILPPALVLLAILAGWTGAEAKSLHPDYQLMRGEVQRYGDWLVGCDNNAECTIVGFPADQLKLALADGAAILPEMSVRISFAGPPGTQPVVDLIPVGKAAEECIRCIPTNQRFRLSASGKPSGQVHSFAPKTLDPAGADFALHAFGKGLTLSGIDPQTGQAAIRFPAEGYRAAFRAMHARRAALKARIADQAAEDRPGELPDGSTMPVPERLKRIPAVETIISGFVPILAEGRCKNEFMANPRQFQFANGAVLWSFECSRSPGSPRTLWDMAPGANALAAPLELPEPRDGKVRAGVDGLEGVTFDWDFGILRSYQFRNGREDCGTFRAWGYTGNGWHMLERREMPLCKGLMPDQWIRTHYTPTDGAGPDE